MQDFPSASFPYQLNVRGQQRELFGSFGIRSQFDVRRGGSTVFMRETPRDRLVASDPVLPLYTVTEDDYPNPLCDRVAGDTLEDRQRKWTFSDGLRRLVTASKSSTKVWEVQNVKAAVKHYREAKSSEDKVDCLRDLVGSIPPWLRKLGEDYDALDKATSVHINNSKYAGGLLSCHKSDDDHCILLSATGLDFRQLKVTKVTKDTDGLLRGDKIQTLEVPQPVYRVTSQAVQNFELSSTLSEMTCAVYNFDSDRDDGPLYSMYSIHSDDLVPWQSCNLSPYIAGEVVLMKQDGNCYLRTLAHLEKVFGPCHPRFATNDSWSTAYFGDHPRQIIHADLTAVQVFDIRKPQPEAVDLFALPSDFLQVRERVRMCQKLTTAPFYHLVATDFSLILTDQRFTKYPVLQWDHVLSTHPQYLSCLSRTNMTQPDSTATSVFIGSQFPAQVHAIDIQLSSSNPPQSLGSPWRLAGIRDLTEWIQFTDDCSNPAVVAERLRTSLAGIQSTEIAGKHVLFQLDGYTEIFYQSFCIGSDDEDVSLSAGSGSQHIEPSPEAVIRAKTWIDSYETIAKRVYSFSSRVVLKDVTSLLEENQSGLPPHVNCSMCMPHIVQLLQGNDDQGFQNASTSASICLSCHHTTDSSKRLLQSVKQDCVTQNVSESTYISPSLASIDTYPSTSALSRLLLKHWNKDTDTQDIWEDWDKEVLKKHKTQRKKTNKSNELPSMSEESVLQRLMERSRLTGDGDSGAGCSEDRGSRGHDSGVHGSGESVSGESGLEQTIIELDESGDTIAPDSPNTIVPDSPNTISPDSTHTILPDSPNTIVPDSQNTIVPGSANSTCTDSGNIFFPYSGPTIVQDSQSTVSPDSWNKVMPGVSSIMRETETYLIDRNADVSDDCCSDISLASSRRKRQHSDSGSISDVYSIISSGPVTVSNTSHAREHISPARSSISTNSVDLFLSQETTPKKRRKKRNSGSSIFSDISNVSVKSFPTYLNSPSKVKES